MRSTSPVHVTIGSKDRFGNKIGKRHHEALFKFTKNKWSADARTTLKTLLNIDIGQRSFSKFLKTEYGKVDLESYMDFQVFKSGRKVADRCPLFQSKSLMLISILLSKLLRAVIFQSHLILSDPISSCLIRIYPIMSFLIDFFSSCLKLLLQLQLYMVLILLF